MAMQVSTFAGATTATIESQVFKNPTSMLSLTSGDVLVADSGGNAFYLVDTSAMDVFKVAGDGTNSHRDGPNDYVRLGNPQGLACGRFGDVYFCDSNHHCIRRMFNGAITTIAGNPKSMGGWSNSDAGQFNNPSSICISHDYSTLYVADSQNHCVRTISIDDIQIGSIGNPKPNPLDRIDGSLAQSTFHYPVWVGCSPVTPHDIFVGEFGKVRRIEKSCVTTHAGNIKTGMKDGFRLDALFGGLIFGGVFTPNGDMYVTDAPNNRIRKIDSEMVTTLAVTVEGRSDGDLERALFRWPFGLCWHGNGDLLVSDHSGKCIRKISNVLQITTNAEFSLENLCNLQFQHLFEIEREHRPYSMANFTIIHEDTQISYSLPFACYAMLSEAESIKNKFALLDKPIRINCNVSQAAFSNAWHWLVCSKFGSEVKCYDEAAHASFSGEKIWGIEPAMLVLETLKVLSTIWKAPADLLNFFTQQIIEKLTLTVDECVEIVSWMIEKQHYEAKAAIIPALYVQDQDLLVPKLQNLSQINQLFINHLLSTLKDPFGLLKTYRKRQIRSIGGYDEFRLPSSALVLHANVIGSKIASIYFSSVGAPYLERWYELSEWRHKIAKQNYSTPLQVSIISPLPSYFKPNFTLQVDGLEGGIPCHDWILYCRWELFRNAMDAGLAESSSSVMVLLPEHFDSVATLQHFVYYVYTGDPSLFNGYTDCTNILNGAEELQMTKWGQPVPEFRVLLQHCAAISNYKPPKPWN